MIKVLAVILFIITIWWAYPIMKHGEWFAATPVPPGWWGLALTSGYEDLAKPETGYGLYHFDFWNGQGGSGREATPEDFTLRPLKDW